MTTTKATVLILGVIGIFFAGIASASTITFNNFSSTSGLTLSGSAGTANTSDRNVLNLTGALFAQSGSAFTSSTINAASFSTSFSFKMTSPFGTFDGTGMGADGLVFVLQAMGPSIGSSGGVLGYTGIWPSIGVEFDTWNNRAPYDQDSNHIGINTNGDIESITASYVAPDFNDGNSWYAWINYDGTFLEVRANQTGVRPAAPLLSCDIDIPRILDTSMAYVGFTAGTGSSWENHTILSWQYIDSYPPEVPHQAPVPVPATLLLFGSGLTGLSFIRSRFWK